ncbi:MAG TPA: TetR family transcriptional regulator [Dermatophilaceae bacterium]|nr:TetR family transcriptional regulator [Dermatophilaceae bacterium]
MTQPGGHRAAKKAATRRSIQREALRLFLADGYDATTVEQIAAAAGVSHMTFFRYFPTKESVVDTDDYDPLVAGLIEGRPAAEDEVAAIHRAVSTGLRAILPEDREALLERSRLILSTPQLRARQADNQHQTRVLFASALARRDGLDAPSYRQEVLAAAALAALTTAVTRWTEGNGQEDLVELVDRAFAALGEIEPR